MKKSILLIILLAGFLSMQSQQTSSTDMRKGVHLGAHFTPGFGTIFTEAYDNLAVDFGMTAGLDVNIYFNKLLGMHTGVTYFNLPWRFKFFEDIGDGTYMREISATVQSIGIPVRFLLTTGQKTVGFYLEAGFAVYFPLSYQSDPDKGILKISTAMFASEMVAGINLKASDKLNFQIAGFSNTVLPVFSNIDSSVGLLYGLKLGMTYKLSK
jgi:hypothetical protein